MRSARNPTPPARSVLLAPIPDDWTPVPPEVAGALWPLEAGGPWEGGTTDHTGRRWTHVPWRGWQPGPPPRTHGGRVYRSREVSRAFARGRRRRLAARAVRYGSAPALLAGATMVVAGALGYGWGWAAAGVTVAAAVRAAAWRWLR